MKNNFWEWFKIRYSIIINSIAFIPVLIAIGFLGLSAFMIYFDYSDTGKQIKDNFGWLSLKDASTARSIIQAIVTGIISLAVFSFSMVMIVLNQAASNMSNRVLDKLIGNNFQQLILGIYLGTIVYGLALLTTIRDIDSGVYVPALSTYFLIILTVIDIFLFIYFLHYITQSVKYETIIKKICSQTKNAIQKKCTLTEEPAKQENVKEGKLVAIPYSGVYEGFHEEYVLKLCKKNDLVISFLYAPGTFLLRGTPFITVSQGKDINDEEIKEFLENVHITNNESIDANYVYGLRQLMEVAIRGLSPGLNDPGTAVEALRAIGDLLLYRLKLYPDNTLKDENGKVRVITKQKPFENIFEEVVLPIWKYGKHDLFLQREMENLLIQFKNLIQTPVIDRLYIAVQLQLSKNEL
jgi:uncharacterized membrane protein